MDDNNNSSWTTKTTSQNSPPFPLRVEQRLALSREDPAQIVGVGAVERQERILDAGAPQLARQRDALESGAWGLVPTHARTNPVR